MGNKSLLLIAGIMLIAGCVTHTSTDAPGAVKARLQLGLYYLAQQDYPAAERNLVRAKQAAPNDFRVVLALARLYQASASKERALETYRQAVKKWPQNGYIANNYGAFLCTLGQYDESHQQFKRAMDSRTVAARIDAWELAGYCALQQKDYQSARSFLEQAIAADSHKWTHVLKRAEQFFADGEQEAATFLLQFYRQLNQSNMDVDSKKVFRSAAGQHRILASSARAFSPLLRYSRYLANEN